MKEGKNMEKPMMDICQLMEYMSISRKTAYALIHSEGFYPAFRVGKKILIHPEKLEKWITEQQVHKEG